MTANVSTKTYTCERCGRVSNNGGNHGRHVKACAGKLPGKTPVMTFAREIPKTHGGYRPGSGRKPLLVGSMTRAFVLDERANQRLERFRRDNGLVGAQDASEALRRIIAIAVPL